MRVDTSLLQSITAADQATKATAASLKSAATTTSFSSQLKAAEKETTKAVPGTSYAEILTGKRAGMYLNTGGGPRNGDAFVLVKHDGREDHIYGTGKDRKVIAVGGAKSEDAAPAADKPKFVERTKKVEGHAYTDILNGKRSGLYLNACGNIRDGMAFALVKRDGREYHIYGTGKDRQVIGLKTAAEKTATTAAPAADAAPSTDAAKGTTTTGSLVTDNPTTP